MKQYAISISLTDGRVINRVTTNQFLALRLMQMFIKGDGVKEARIKIQEASQTQTELDQAKESKSEQTTVK